VARLCPIGSNSTRPSHVFERLPDTWKPTTSMGDFVEGRCKAMVGRLRKAGSAADS
jgi:hypothetical protein